ncbi:hypothetical protein SmJEL517_g04766 [Synchytrium microbalum]|uniref:SH3 domain-containing protein n=1 Tax=Synchytrium microbalum TaxID=1806994 RepID=A0A507BQJ2_9FUNG|nr:uncharacterized protein SmJEL517_g04766 [Synchytrium microbalum]TPX32060.1 hypothetical protein SmJEL517_g04766 [Synchytrium microbalum]
MSYRSSSRAAGSSAKPKESSKNDTATPSTATEPLKGDTEPRKGDAGYAVALYDYRGATDEELDFDEGDTFEILSRESEDWWYVRFTDDAEVEGYVPCTYVQLTTADEIRQGEEDDQSGDENAEKEDDYDEDEDDEGESDDYDDDEDEGRDYENMFFPSLALAADLKAQVAHYAKYRDLLTPSTPTASALASPPVKVEGLSDLPTGFRPSTLAFAAKHGVGRLASALLPKLDESGLGFTDLALDLKKNRIRRRTTKLNVAFSILEAKHIPPPPTGLRVLGRHVRVAIFDRVAVVANMLSVNAVVNQDWWRFSTKASLLFPKDDENTCLLRANAADFRLCVLFELCLVVAKPNSTATGEDVEDVSCGWGIFPLYTADGGPVENKTYEIKLYGGTPLDKDAKTFEVEEKKGFLSNLINPSRSPKLSIRVWKLSKSAMRRINQLPDTLLTFLSSVPPLAMFRSLLATCLLVPHESRGLNLAPSCDPALALVPFLMEQNDLARLLEIVWEKRFHAMKRREKRSAHTLHQRFLDACLAVWPLAHIVGMPEYIPGDFERSQDDKRNPWRWFETALWIIAGVGLTIGLKIVPILYAEALHNHSIIVWIWISATLGFFGIFAWLQYIRPRVLGIPFDPNQWEKTAPRHIQVATACGAVSIVSLIVVYWKFFNVLSFIIVACQVMAFMATTSLF